MKRKGFFLLALLCGLLAAGSTYIYLHNSDRSAALELRPLVVAKTNISARSVIKADELTLKDVPLQGYPQGGQISIDNVAGTVALLNLAPGDPVLNAMLEHSNPPAEGENVSSNTSGETALTVPDGLRAVAIPIGLVSGVGYAVKPGDHVDVLVTIDVQDPTDPTGSKSETVTSLIAQDVLVLNTGDSLNAGDQKVAAKSYTLALSVPQAMAVTLGSEKGSLRLLLRNPVNQDQRTDAPATMKIFTNPNYFKTFK